MTTPDDITTATTAPGLQRVKCVYIVLTLCKEMMALIRRSYKFCLAVVTNNHLSVKTKHGKH